MQLTNYTFFNPKNHLYTNPIKGLRGYSLSYRFAFNGKEKDDEVVGAGNSIAYELRKYDSRLGRFNSTDQREMEYPWQSSYAYFENSPIATIDFKGGGKTDDYTAKKDGTFKFKKTDDKFDRYLVEDDKGKTTEVLKVDKPDSKKAELVRFPDKGQGFTRYGDKDAGGDHYVKPEIAAALFGAVAYFSKKNPGVDVQFGDMSNSSGQRPNSSHQTHGGGRNVDFRYVRTDGAMLPVHVNSPVFDVTRSQDLINSFGKFGFGGDKSIGSYPNSKGSLLEGTFKLGGHGDHGHLQNFNRK